MDISDPNECLVTSVVDSDWSENVDVFVLSMQMEIVPRDAHIWENLVCTHMARTDLCKN